MEMNEILNGLNSSYCNDGVAPQCPPTQGMPCSNNSGFGSWIWILLILFYSQGFGGRNTSNCCKKSSKNDYCCNKGNEGIMGSGSCSSYLFLLVILFLCNGCSGNSIFGNGNLFGGCC